jgi:hypothetical protein
MDSLKQGRHSSSQAPKFLHSPFDDDPNTNFDNQSDTQRYQETQQSEQLQIHAADLDWVLGISSAPGNGSQSEGSNQDFSFWPAWSRQWNSVHWHQPLGVEHCHGNYPVPNTLRIIPALDEQSELFCKAPEDRLHSNQIDATGFSTSETVSFQNDESITQLLSQPDVIAVHSELPTSDSNHFIADNDVNSENLTDDRDVGGMRCWDESLIDLNGFKQPLSVADDDLMSADIFTGTICKSCRQIWKLFLLPSRVSRYICGCRR